MCCAAARIACFFAAQSTSARRLGRNCFCSPALRTFSAGNTNPRCFPTLRPECIMEVCGSRRGLPPACTAFPKCLRLPVRTSCDLHEGVLRVLGHARHERVARAGVRRVRDRHAVPTQAGLDALGGRVCTGRSVVVAVSSCKESVLLLVEWCSDSICALTGRSSCGHRRHRWSRGCRSSPGTGSPESSFT